MKIAFVGASGYGNVGDDTYPLVFRKLFPAHELQFFNSDLPAAMPEDAGLLVVGGGGLLYNVGGKAAGDASPHFRCLRHYLDWAGQRGLPWGILSCGFQFAPGDEARPADVLAPWIPYLRQAQFVTLRSPRCVEIFRDLTGRSDGQFLPDAAYLYNPVVPSSEGREPMLTIVPAGLVHPRDSFTNHLIRTFRASGGRIRWLSMGAERDDAGPMAEARTRFPEAGFDESRSPERAFAWIGQSHLVYTGRYHGMVFARKNGVPFLVPQQAPYKITHEHYEHPLALAAQHGAILDAFLGSPPGDQALV
jgi:hypothetical protein